MSEEMKCENCYDKDTPAYLEPCGSCLRWKKVHKEYINWKSRKIED